MTRSSLIIAVCDAVTAAFWSVDSEPMPLLALSEQDAISNSAEQIAKPVLSGRIYLALPCKCLPWTCETLFQITASMLGAAVEYSQSIASPAGYFTRQMGELIAWDMRNVRENLRYAQCFREIVWPRCDCPLVQQCKRSVSTPQPTSELYLLVVFASLHLACTVTASWTHVYHCKRALGNNSSIL